MYRMAAASTLAFLTASLAHAHFPFIVPDGASAKVVFSDDLSPDPNVNIEKIAGTKLTLRDAAGKETALEWKKDNGYYAVAAPGTGPRVIFGVTDYGVLQKGDSKPFKLVYYSKAVLGDASPREAAVGGALALEIVPVGAFGKVKFQVLAAGKPLSEIEVTLLPPAGAKKEVKTDKDGFSPEFEAVGRYGVVAKRFDVKSGDFAGKKYDEIRNYATLVYDFGSKP